MAGLKVFVDTFSQPCRAILMLLEINKIPYETKIIKLAKGENLYGVFQNAFFFLSGEHMTEEYKKINPIRKVPAIDDGGFKLTER